MYIVLQDLYVVAAYTSVLMLLLLCGYSNTTARRVVPAYTKCDVQLINVSPEDVLIQSETCRASNRK